MISLNSGSNGNCYYVGNDRDAVFIDAGISCRAMERRMISQGLAISKVRAIFITHEHTDHTRGVEVISKKYRIPVYITTATYRNSRLTLAIDLVRDFTANVPVPVGELSVLAFQKKHDASDPHSFIVSGNGVTVGIMTDIGIACNNVVQHLVKCHAVFLEANYDEVMLETGRYPLFLKKRIRGGEGHLSNAQALELFINHRPSFMKLLVLSHLSEHNNDPKLVRDLFTGHAGETRVVVASRYEASDVFSVE